ncbi:MAG: glycosyltransferase [Acidimicrobiia bacterium]
METDETPAGGPTVLDSAPAEEAPELASVAPPVVAVVATRDPKPGFEATLATLGAQDYPELTVLVVDAGSAQDPTGRVAAVLPHAFVHRTEPAGFAAAANVALDTVEGASFLLFCHDDVELDPSCVRLLVEEAFRSNAAVLGPKLVPADDPQRLLSVGLAIDRFGVPFSGIEPGEFDQEQHDGVRDVFFVPSAALLVRADLFAEVGGFDVDAFPGAEDLDLCWRARLVGGRVLVVPDARAAHREATASVPRSQRIVNAEVDRNRVRTVLKSYSFGTLLWLVPFALVVASVESIALLLLGRRARARSVLGAWTHNLTHPRRWRRARQAVQRTRTVHDRELWYLQIHGSARAAAYFARRLHTEDRFHSLSVAGRGFVGTTARSARRPAAVAALVLAFVYLIGSRLFIADGVPAVGSFLRWTGVQDAAATFGSAWRYSLTGHALPATPAFVMLGALDALFLGHASLAQTVVVLAAVPVGAFGVFRLARPVSASVVPAAVAGGAYVVAPVSRNMLAGGRLGPLMLFAVLPFAVRVVWRGAGCEFGSADLAGQRLRLRTVVGLAVLIGVATAVFPSAPLVVAAVALAAILSVPLVGGARAAARSVVLVGLATAIAAVLLIPWPLSLFGDGRRNALGWVFPSPWSLGDVLRFHTGPSGAGWEGLALLAAAGLPLLVATGPRFRWAVRAWCLALVGFAAVWIPAHFWPDAGAPAPEAALGLAALGVALAVGIGVAVFADDLRRVRFGWRQVAAVVAVGALVMPALAFVVDAGNGRWHAATRSASTLEFLRPQAAQGSYRMLWLGDPRALSGDPALRPNGTGWALARNGPGDTRDLWPTPATGGDDVVAESIDLLTSARTNRFGRLVAPMGVRYVAVPAAAATTPSGPAATAALRRALSGQLDLVPLTLVDPRLTVYENRAWAPIAASGPGGAAAAVPANSADPKRDALLTDLSAYAAVDVPGTTRRPVPAGPVLWGENFSSSWVATSAGARLAHERSFGWSNGYRLPSPGRVTLTYRDQHSRNLVVVLDVLLWSVLAVALLATRPRGHRPRAGRSAGADERAFWGRS